MQFPTAVRKILFIWLSKPVLHEWSWHEKLAIIMKNELNASTISTERVPWNETENLTSRHWWDRKQNDFFSWFQALKAVSGNAGTPKRKNGTTKINGSGLEMFCKQKFVNLVQNWTPREVWKLGPAHPINWHKRSRGKLSTRQRLPQDQRSSEAGCCQCVHTHISGFFLQKDKLYKRDVDYLPCQATLLVNLSSLWSS